ncbi:MAG: hypothetical protein K9K76_11845 [Halanaerobiales bacterium]|nr:hypothetical protein [Halanaerobiales bacterium]
MMRLMNALAWLTISLGYILIGYVIWSEIKDKIAECKKSITKRKNSAEDTAE